MKIAILVNHNTAAKFYCEIFKKLGHTVYVPLYCSIEKNTLQYSEVLKYRNIEMCEYVSILDKFDFYKEEGDVNEIYDILVNNFDIVITLHIINKELNNLLSKSSLIVYYIMWGDVECQYKYIDIHNNILINNKKYFLFCHDFLINNYDIKFNIPKEKYKFARIGINDISNFENTYTNTKNNDIIIIASGIHLKPYLQIFIESVTSKNSHITFNIFGKNNNIIFPNKNIILHSTFENENDLYNKIKNFKLCINISHYKDILQYSTIEMACLNIPFLYSFDSAVNKIINNNNYFVYNNNDELCDKINYLCKDDNLNKYKNVYHNNNSIIYNKYKFESVINYYHDILYPEKKIIEKIAPCLGIGDILIEKIKCISNGLYLKKIEIITDIYKRYRKDGYLEFINKFINLLFEDIEIVLDDNMTVNNIYRLPIKEYPFKYTYLYDLIKNKINIDIKYSNYIIFNTKVRIWPCLEKFLNEDIYLLDIFLKSFKTKKNIILLGERNIENSIEKNLSTSIYNNLLSLKNNNNVIDLTYDCGFFKDNFDDFIYDIELINKADCNINLGLGGSLQLIQSFSKNNICYFSTLAEELKNTDEHIYDILYNYQSINNYIYTDIKSFLNKIYNDYNIDNKNILYILNKNSLTDYEIPFLINNGYGVLTSEKKYNLKCESFYKDKDNFLNLNYNIITKLNNVNWYNNNILISEEIIKILNNNFKFIILTLLTAGPLLNQLISEYRGIILYRFFGRESNYSYKSLLIKNINLNNKIKFIFSNPEIYKLEKSFDNFFNDTNSFIVKLGLSDSLMTKIINTYYPINNKICFINSKINNCQYYTNIYNKFINDFKTYDYLLLGKNNNIYDKNKLENLDDEKYYKKISECKLMYYHSKEPRHLHYHPLEGIVIGIPIIFHKESLLTSYLPNSLGKSNNIYDVKNKINRILSNDIEFINSIINEQNKIINTLTIDYNKNNFDEVLSIV